MLITSGGTSSCTGASGGARVSVVPVHMPVVVSTSHGTNSCTSASGGSSASGGRIICQCQWCYVLVVVIANGGMCQ